MTVELIDGNIIISHSKVKLPCIDCGETGIGQALVAYRGRLKEVSAFTGAVILPQSTRFLVLFIVAGLNVVTYMFICKALFPLTFFE